MEQLQENLYKIGAVANLTGLSTHTIRAWERRYGMELSDRTDGGTRLYSHESLERLMLIKKLLDSGESISVLSGLSEEQLEGRILQFEGRRNGRVAMSHESRKVTCAVLGQSIFDRKQYRGSTGAELSIQYSSQLLQDFDDYLERNHQDLELGIVFCEFLNSQNVGTLISFSNRFPEMKWVVVFQMGSNSDLLELLKEGVHSLRGPLPESVLAESIASQFGSSVINGSNPNAFEHSLAASAPIFTQEELTEWMNGKNAFGSHLSMLIQNLSVFEEFCKSQIDSNKNDDTVSAKVLEEAGKARSVLEHCLKNTCSTSEISSG